VPPSPESGRFVLPEIGLTADVVLFTGDGDGLAVLLVERRYDPFRGALALPGGFVDQDEGLEEAALRELAEETGVELAPGVLRQLGAYGAPNRDPRMRVVTVAFWARLDRMPDLAPGSDAAAATMVPVAQILAEPDLTAFDHHRIISEARERAGGY
jgi:8-oxo-dGTP diphosphatase